jgi:hypothetical protein
MGARRQANRRGERVGNRAVGVAKLYPSVVTGDLEVVSRGDVALILYSVLILSTHVVGRYLRWEAFCYCVRFVIWWPGLHR